MKLETKLFLLILTTTWLLASCAPAVTFSPEMKTAVAGTVVAMSTQTAAAELPPVQPTATIDPLATFTSIPTLPTAIAPTATAVPALWISEWKDYNYPANTVVKAREAFTKTWLLTNGGTAAWQKNYTIEFVSGDNMGVYTVPLGVVVEPGKSVKISLNLVAPASLGKHSAYFILRTNNGVAFGFGDNADRPFSVNILIKDYFAVTGATVKASVPPGATCPVDITLTAQINANGAGDVIWYIDTSAGKTEAFTMNFTESAKKDSAPITFTIASPGDLTAAVYIDTPNHQRFSEVTIPSPCTP
jgi:hypothetical protein